MIYILISIPFFLLAGAILNRNYQSSYGMQTWHGFAIRLLSFSGFVCMCVGVLLLIYEEDPYYKVDAENNVDEQLNQAVVAEQPPVIGRTVIRDTCALSPYFLPIIAYQLDSTHLIVPVMVIGHEEYYCFRIGALDKLLPVVKTEITRNGLVLSLITEKREVLCSTWFGFKSERREEVHYRVNLVSSYIILYE